ncbi:MAG: phosphatase PAP2 family protein [Robinsoniella sp.]|nr:phosphatase PAP2 family protein [Robinsoniella sp.]
MNLLHFLAQYRTPAGEAIFQLFTYFGQDLFIILILCAIYWCLNKKLAYQIGLSFFVSGLLMQILKITFRIPRPWILDPSFEAVASAIPAATGYSFPSGHTQAATALFGVLALSFKKPWQRAACIFAFVVVGFSRLYLGVHTPKDVLVSMAITFFVVLAVSRLNAYMEHHFVSPVLISVVLAICSIVTAVYASSLLSQNVIEAKYASDCLKSAGAGLAFALAWYLEHTHLNFGTHVPLKRQIGKFVTGILVTALLEFGLKYLIGDGLFLSCLRYFILVLWALVIFPLLDKKYSWGFFVFE